MRFWPFFEHKSSNAAVNSNIKYTSSTRGCLLEAPITLPQTTPLYIFESMGGINRM